MTTIRKATHDDIPWLIVELKKFSDHYPSKKKLYPGDDLATLGMANLIDGHVVLVAERDGKLIGFIAGLVTPHFMNPDILVLTESFWWVTPEHRGDRAGILLFSEFVNIGRQCVDWIMMTTEAKSPISDDAMTKRGFTKVENNFLMEVA